MEQMFFLAIRMATVLAIGLFPISLIVYAYSYVDPGLLFKNHLIHEISIGFAIIWSASISYVSYQCYRIRQETFLRYMTLAFLAQTIIYSMHGLLTRTGTEFPILFILYGPASRVAMAAFLSAAVLKYGTNILDEVGRKSWLVWIGLFILVIPAIALLALSPIGTNFYIRAGMEALSIGIYLTALGTIYYRKIETPLMRLYSVALVLFAQSSLAFILVKAPWSHMFWLAHVIFVAGVFVISYGLIKARSRSSSFTETFSEELLYSKLAEQVSKQKLEIEARKKAETKLTESEQRFKNFSASAADRFWETGADHRFTYVSPPTKELPVPEDRLLGAFPWELNPLNLGNNGLEQSMDKLFDGHEAFRKFQFEIQMLDESVLYLSMNGTPNFDGSGKFRGYCGTTLNETFEVEARKLVEKKMLASKTEAEMANRSKSEFLANMSHELRTPLNAIIGFSEVLSEKIFGPLGNEKQEEYVKNIHGSGQHLLDLINDILDVSAIEADRLDLDETDVDIHDAVKASLLLLKSRAEQGGVELINTIDGHQPVIHADKRRMKQVLVNLLSNAVKFTEAGGTVSIGAESHDDGATVIFVSDTGIGMTDEEITRAMEPFGRVHAAEVRESEGTGLGLPLTKMLVEAQGGRLKITSEPGMGTTVKVEFAKV
ncbi:MAG: hypothetical protein HN632_16765 [Rhodospirillaceae bacterium]|nr:hypothetical protein [Rhodospirillaceae bacterium]